MKRMFKKYGRIVFWYTMFFPNTSWERVKKIWGRRDLERYRPSIEDFFTPPGIINGCVPFSLAIAYKIPFGEVNGMIARGIGQATMLDTLPFFNARMIEKKGLKESAFFNIPEQGYVWCSENAEDQYEEGNVVETTSDYQRRRIGDFGGKYPSDILVFNNKKSIIDRIKTCERGILITGGFKKYKFGHAAPIVDGEVLDFMNLGDAKVMMLFPTHHMCG